MNVHDEVYLGDGLFASIDHGMIKLRCPAPREGYREHVIFMNMATLRSFEDWLVRLRLALPRREANG